MRKKVLYIDGDQVSVKTVGKLVGKYNIPIVFVHDTSHEFNWEHSNVTDICVDQEKESTDRKILNSMKAGDFVATKDKRLMMMAECVKKGYAMTPDRIEFELDRRYKNG